MAFWLLNLFGGLDGAAKAGWRFEPGPGHFANYAEGFAISGKRSRSIRGIVVT